MNVEVDNGGDIERQLDARLAQLEAEQAKQVNEAIAAKREQEANERRQRQIVSLAAVAEGTGCCFLVSWPQLADILDKHGLEHDEDGLRALIAKRPSIVDGRIGKKFLQSVNDAPERPEKPKTMADFPKSKSEFESIDQRIEFVNLFGPDIWENMPLRPRASATPLHKLTAEDWRSLTVAQKAERVNELVAQGRDPEAFITHLPRRKDS